MTTVTKKKQQSKRADKRNKQRAKDQNWLTAKTADRYVCYEKSVQEPEAEIEFIDQVWQERRGRLAKHVREDFCGTAISSCQWVKTRPDNTAVSIDLDEGVLKVAEQRVETKLDESQRKRIRLVKADVLTVDAEPVESILAMNFSYFLFKKRSDLLAYFRHVREGLVEDGIFMCDAYGGYESFEELEEERACDGFTYVWDQHLYNPITGDAVNHIHFRFPDGSELHRAFTYEWRLWTLPEIQDLLTEAGFARVTVYWEGTDEETEEGNGEFSATTKGEACAGWIAYIVAEKTI